MTTREAMFLTLKDNDLDGLRAILDAEPGSEDMGDENGISFLMQTLYYRKPEMAALVRARRREITWHEAAALGETQRLTRLLAMEPALINSYAGDGFTALHLTSFFGEPESLKVLISHGANPNLISLNPMKLAAIHSATAGGHTACVKELAEAGADLNLKQHGGYTALMSAASQGNAEITKLLLDKGADPALRDDKNSTASDHATRGGHTTILEMLT